jgi:hypothetical protein
MVLMKTTYWIDPEDNPLIIHEGNSVLIKVNDLRQGQSLEVYLAPMLLPLLRIAVDNAELGAGSAPPLQEKEGTPLG